MDINKLEPSIYDIAPETCRCGRLTTPPHCPYCGSISTFGHRASNLYNALGVEIAKGLQCRKCGSYYNTLESCVAPFSKAAQRAIDTKQQVAARAAARAAAIQSKAEEIAKIADLQEKLQVPETRQQILGQLFGKPKPPSEE